jgi:hypothetical protein
MMVMIGRDHHEIITGSFGILPSMSRLLVLALLTASISIPAHAFDRGDVLLENRVQSTVPTYELWDHFGWRFAVLTGFPLIDKTIPFTGPGHFIAPAPNEIVFHSDRTVSVWDGAPHAYNEPGKGYAEIFTDDAELSEIAPMRSGNFLVAERGPKLIEFNLHGRVADHAFPNSLGARHIELLADQCTVLYTTGNDDPAGNRVHRMNICTQQPQTDFASLTAGEYAGAIRQLQTGDVVVANGNAILQFNAGGSFVRSYPFPGVTHLALSTDGLSFWGAGVNEGRAELRHFDPSVADGKPESVQLGNDEMVTTSVPDDVSDLVVVGEWRAALTTVGRSRAVRRR